MRDGFLHYLVLFVLLILDTIHCSKKNERKLQAEPRISLAFLSHLPSSFC